LVPVEGSVLTGGLTYEDRRGTVVDWNLSFTADGVSSSRSFRSGTLTFMAPVLLDDEPIARRTLAHDMESFLAVIIWIATIDYENEPAFLATPLAVTLLDKKKAPLDIVQIKENWFQSQKSFRKRITEHFQPLYRKDSRFIACLSKLRLILYLGNGDDNDGMEMEKSADPKEDLFRTCMKDIDDYLNEQKGCDEMQWIDSQALASRAHISQSLAQEEIVAD